MSEPQGTTGPITKVRYIGLNVHRDSITLATADEGRAPAMKFKTIPNDWPRLLKALRLLTPNGRRLEVCYEAGPSRRHAQVARNLGHPA